MNYSSCRGSVSTSDDALGIPVSVSKIINSGILDATLLVKFLTLAYFDKNSFNSASENSKFEGTV